MKMNRWTLVAEFDSVQEMIDEEDYEGGMGEAADFYAYVRECWDGMDEDELDEDTKLEGDTVTITCPTLDNLEEAITWLLMQAVPKKFELIRNDSRTGI